MKKLFGLAFLLSWSGCFSQTYLTQVKSIVTKSWGYANERGDIVIPAEFDRSNEFSADGLAVVYVKKTQEFYFIDVTGKRINPEFTGIELLDASNFGVDGVAEGFHSRLIAVKKRDHWGYMNTSGKLAISMKYDLVTVFDDGLAIAKTGDRYLVLDTNGQELPVDVRNLVEVKHFSERLAPYRVDKEFGFINEQGKVAIPAKFKSVGYFRNGLAWAKENNGMLGYIDTKGEWVVKPQFEVGKDFDAESGFARVKSSKGWGYVNRSGEMLYVEETEYWGDFSGGLAEGRMGSRRGFFNNKGKWVIPPSFDGVRDFKNGFAAAKSNDRWGMINKTGGWVIQPTFIAIKDMEVVK